MTNNKEPFKKIAVLAGGIGQERDISLQSGHNIYQALQKTGLEIVFFDITPDNMSILDDKSVDIFFPILHGRFGEDGRLQQVLEEKQLVYTGSDSVSSRLAFDKRAAKDKFLKAGVPTPPVVYFGADADNQTIREGLETLNTERFVVKPICQGSSVGVQIIRGKEQTAEAADQCVRQFGDAMIEAFITGREITVGIVDQVPLPVLEIRPKQAFYDFHAKYIDDNTEFLFDTIENADLIQKIQQIAMTSHKALGCRHFSRVDLILTEDGQPFVLEINTLPGFTSHSLLPMAAAKAGMTADQLCLKILQAAWRDTQTETERRIH